MDATRQELLLLTGLSFAGCFLAFSADFFITAVGFAGFTGMTGVLAIAHSRLR
jgi:hypothetical protein